LPLRCRGKMHVLNKEKEKRNRHQWNEHDRRSSCHPQPVMLATGLQRPELFPSSRGCH
jgi:hypothetical protein